MELSVFGGVIMIFVLCSESSVRFAESTRASYLLGQLGLESRLISLESAGNMDLTIAPDYEISNARVETLRKFSLTFIRNSLRDNYE